MGVYDDHVLPRIINEYVRPGKIRLELRLLRFIGPDSDRGANAAHMAAGSNRMWQFADLFYRNQGADYGRYWHGRYTMPFAIGFPLILVWRPTGVEWLTDRMRTTLCGSAWIVSNVAFVAAQRGFVDEVIQPRQTRAARADHPAPKQRFHLGAVFDAETSRIEPGAGTKQPRGRADDQPARAAREHRAAGPGQAAGPALRGCR